MCGRRCHERVDYLMWHFFFFFKQKTAYEIPKRDWCSDVCSSDLILVAMREATKGEPFDQIIESEFEEIESREAKIAYLAVCLATSFNNVITTEQFLSLTDLFPNEALELLD